MSHEVIKVAKKCHVLFQWPLITNDIFKKKSNVFFAKQGQSCQSK